MVRKTGGAIWILVSLVVGLAIGALPIRAVGDVTDASVTPTAGTPAWLEPRGLSILDLVGFVPESDLKGMIITDRPGYGILRYEAGKRVGNTVTVTATAYTRYDRSWDGALFGCLGVLPRQDHWPAVVPETKLRIYTASGQDITHKVVPHFYVPAGLKQPERGPDDQSEPNKPTRYARLGNGDPLPRDAQGNLIVPANMGCDLMMQDGTQAGMHEYKTLTVVFTAEIEPHINVQVVSRKSLDFKSYIGPGYYGKFEKLAEQMRNRFPGRHDKFNISRPAEANYVIINFPPQPVDMYSNLGSDVVDNVAYPTGGTYRFTFWENNQEYLTVDFVSSIGIPLDGGWIDAGQAGNVVYLPYKRSSVAVAALEYLVPEGVSYNSCMLTGTCSSTILDQIYNTSMTMKVIFLKVTRTDCALQRIPLRMVGKLWTPGMLAQTASSAPALDAAPAVDPARSLVRASFYASPTLTQSLYLPLVLNRLCVSPPPDDPEGCPCGWFDSIGRMLSFIP